MTKISGQFLISGQFKISGISGQLGDLDTTQNLGKTGLDTQFLAPSCSSKVSFT